MRYKLYINLNGELILIDSLKQTLNLKPNEKLLIETSNYNTAIECSKWKIHKTSGFTGDWNQHGAFSVQK